MSQAAEFSLPHVSGGRQVSLSDYRGTPVVLIVSGKGSADEARSVGESLGDTYLDRIRIISVVDMSGVPKLARPVANRLVERGYKDAVKGVTDSRQRAGLPMPSDPTELAVFVRDADGDVARSYGVQDVESQVAVILVGTDGEVVTTARGAGAVEEVAQALGPA